jgi:catechol 2,3-dioxygenase-like lactoylglutathione lyase family enzyme
MVKPHGLYETHIPVRDLKSSVAFYQKLGLTLACEEPERNVAFLWIIPNQHMIGLWQKPEDQVNRSHFAISVSLEELEKAPAFLEKLGIPHEDFFRNVGGEPTVHSWVPAVSVYFKDPDGHSVEYISVLPDAPRPELGAIPLSEWRKLHQKQKNK